MVPESPAQPPVTWIRENLTLFCPGVNQAAIGRLWSSQGTPSSAIPFHSRLTPHASLLRFTVDPAAFGRIVQVHIVCVCVCVCMPCWFHTVRQATLYATHVTPGSHSMSHQVHTTCHTRFTQHVTPGSHSMSHQVHTASHTRFTQHVTPASHSMSNQVHTTCQTRFTQEVTPGSHSMSHQPHTACHTRFTQHVTPGSHSMSHQVHTAFHTRFTQERPVCTTILAPVTGYDGSAVSPVQQDSPDPTGLRTRRC